MDGSHIVEHCVGVKILLSAVGVSDSCHIVCTVVGTGREVGTVVHLLVNDGLNGFVLAGNYGDTAAVEGIVGLSVGVTLHVLKILNDLFGELIDVVGVGSVIRGDGYVGLLNSCVNIIRHGLIIFILVDVALLQHIAQNLLAALLILLGMGDGIVLGRVLSDGSDYRTL